MSQQPEIKETFLIVDVSNLGYRAHHAMNNRPNTPPLTTSKGKLSGHVYGSVKSLLWILRDILKDYKVTMVFCYDGENAKQSRLEILPTYKGNRTKGDFNPIPDVKEVLKLWDGIHVEQAGREGDDAVAACVKMRKGKPCIIFSGDLDFSYQLANPCCQVYSPNKKGFLNAIDLMEHYHLDNNPKNVPLAKALFGDTSDNIIGCKRLLKKQVAGLINDPSVTTPEDFYGKLVTKPDGMTDNTYTKLMENKEQVFKNYQVIIPQLDFDKESFTVVKDNVMKLKEKLMEYECKSVMDDLDWVLG